MINFLNLEYFLVVAEELNITKAAHRLFISQQSLSNHISNLEKEFDVALFDRTTPLTLTYAGEALKGKARQILTLKDETYRELTDIKDFTSGRLSIGLSHTRGRMTLPGILPAYHEKFAHVNLHLMEGNTRELDEALKNGKVDLIIGMLPFSLEDMESIPLCEEEVLMVIPDQILKQAFPENFEEVRETLSRSIDLKLLKKCPFLMLNKGNRVRTIADGMFEDARITPQILLETENIETVLALARKGMGITFYPRMLLSDRSTLHNLMNENDGLNFYSLNYNKAHSILAIGYLKNRYLSQAAREFIRLVQENI